MSLYLNVDSYGIGAAHGNQTSYAINYDLKRRRELQLSDVFEPHAKYLEFVSQYCMKDLTRRSTYVFSEALRPRAEHFRSWNVTRAGIRFSFDRCAVLSCSEGEQQVVIPWADMNLILNSNFFRTV